MQAIILAAGMGKRLKELTKNNTKCMVKVNGVTLIERMLKQIDKKNLTRIVIVVGYEGKKLIDFIGTLSVQTPVCFIENPIYDKTNNIYSLALAKDWLVKDDTLLFESDLIFEDEVLDMLINDKRDTLALVDKYESWMDGTCLKLDDHDNIIGFASGKRFDFSETKDYYKTVNLYKFSRIFSITHYVPFLQAYQAALGENEYYEQVLKVIAALDDTVIKAKRLDGQLWYEIDDIQDLDIAESLFAPDEDERVRLLQGRYGGYWRYPKLLDFCYLVNPYYPPQKMKDELRANFDTLLTEYPSGMRVNSLLAARNFGVHQENIIIGNGAAELIKSLMGGLKGKTGFVRPTFEEYPNRYNEADSVSFCPDNKDFTYTADDLMGFFEDKEIDNLVVVNPDNPSGNYIPKTDILRLIDWTKARGIKLLVDESFIDFADETDSTIIEQDILDNNPHLYVMKSISKSYGVPGLRLGVLASGDKETISFMKKDAAIWNINSLGEYFLQIQDKYKDSYLAACQQIADRRKEMIDALLKCKHIKVYESQANYLMCYLTGTMTAEELCNTLMDECGLLIKDLSTKDGIKGKNYIRLAVKDEEENAILIQALNKYLK